MATMNELGVTTFTTPSDTEVMAVRVVDAPRSLVWDMWTKPEHVSSWLLGPEGWTMPICEIDLRVGGSWRFGWSKGGKGDFEMTGEYREIAPPERLVYTERWGAEWPEAINILVLTEENGRTTMTATVRYPSQEDRDKAMATGMTDGWSRSYDVLDEYLAKLG